MHQENTQLKLQQIFNLQRKSFYDSPISTLEQRIKLLQQLSNLLTENKEHIAKEISRDFGHRSRHETLFVEIFGTLEEIKYAQRYLKQWMEPKKRDVSIWFKPAYAYLLPQPLGVVGIISPWNYPISLMFIPLVGALAAGNRVMIKAPDRTPLTSELLKNLVAKYFSHEEVTVITGSGEVGQEFARLPFDYLLFTGSAGIGRSVMRSASENLTPVTLELGGKSPAIIGPDADLKNSLKKIISTKLFNAGQTCIATDYILLPRGQEEKFLKIAKKIVKKRYPKIFTNPDYTSIIDSYHLDRLQKYVDDAKAKGATVVPLAVEENLVVNKKMLPVAILNTHATMLVLQEEVFGPLLPVVTYETLEDAVSYVKQHPKPLSLYYFGKNKEQIDYVLNNTFAGGAVINDCVFHYFQGSLPFGGVGSSGMGQYHGEYGFNTFTKLKPIFYQRRWSLISFLYPPYGMMLNLFNKIFIR